MTEQEFTSKMEQAESRYRLSSRPGYYEGYMRGLRRFYYGSYFGTLQEHEEWLGMAYRWDGTAADQGRGYHHGLQGIRPTCD
jgi:hypothetical protein